MDHQYFSTTASPFGRPPLPSRDGSTPRFTKYAYATNGTSGIDNGDGSSSNQPGPLFLYSPGLSPIRAQQTSLMNSPAENDTPRCNLADRERATRSLMAMTPPSLNNRTLTRDNSGESEFLQQQSLLVDISINASLHPMSLLLDQSLRQEPATSATTTASNTPRPVSAAIVQQLLLPEAGTRKSPRGSIDKGQRDVDTSNMTAASLQPMSLLHDSLEVQDIDSESEAQDVNSDSDIDNDSVDDHDNDYESDCNDHTNDAREDYTQAGRLGLERRDGIPSAGGHDLIPKLHLPAPRRTKQRGAAQGTTPPPGIKEGQTNNLVTAAADAVNRLRDPSPSVASTGATGQEIDPPERVRVNDTPTRFDEEALRRPSLPASAGALRPQPYPAYEDSTVKGLGVSPVTEVKLQPYGEELEGGVGRSVGGVKSSGGGGGGGGGSGGSGGGGGGGGGAYTGSSSGRSTSGSRSRSEGHVYRVVMDDNGVPSLVPLDDSSPQSMSQQRPQQPSQQPVTRNAVTQTSTEEEPIFAAFSNTWRSRSSNSMWGNTYPSSFRSSSRGGLGREPLRNFSAMFSKYKTSDTLSPFWGSSPSKSSAGYKQRLDRRYHNLCTRLLSPED